MSKKKLRIKNKRKISVNRTILLTGSNWARGAFAEEYYHIDSQCRRVETNPFTGTRRFV